MDLDRINKAKGDLIAVYSQMNTLLAPGKEEFLADTRNSLALKYLLIETVEAIADICQHLLAKTKGIPCEGYVDCAIKAGREGLIHAELANKLRRLADLRNSLIHRYWIIDDEMLYDQSAENKEDIVDFVSQIELFLASQRKGS